MLRNKYPKLVILSLMVFGAFSRTVYAEAVISGEITESSPRPYCGVNCLYAALLYYGIDSDYQALMTRYLTSRDGSSIEDLVRGCRTHGLQAQPVKGLSIRDLELLRCPGILHVKSSRANREYSHYVLFLGVQEPGIGLVLDPPAPVEKVALSELGARWAGRAILVSNDKVSLAAVGASSRWRIIVAAILLVGGSCFSRFIRRRYFKNGEQPGMVVLQVLPGVLVILLLTSILALAASVTQGWFSDNNGIELIQAACADSFTKRLSVNEATRAMQKGAVFVDARLKRDFEAGHITNALSIPVTSTLDKVKEAVKGVKKDHPIVIYCQSNNCPYAGRVAGSLMAAGFINLSILEGGWLEWREEE